MDRAAVSQERLAEKLEMSSAANVSQQLWRLDRKQARAKVPKPKKQFLDEANAPKP